MDLFADCFKSVLQNSFFELDQILDISNVDLCLADVEDALSSLDSKTSFDSDGVANIVLNKCYLHLSLPLFLLFKKSLSSGVFLDRWKISKLVPIHKSGCKQDICNYRPISKIPCVPKIFETSKEAIVGRARL